MFCCRVFGLFFYFKEFIFKFCDEVGELLDVLSGCVLEFFLDLWYVFVNFKICGLMFLRGLLIFECMWDFV